MKGTHNDLVRVEGLAQNMAAAASAAGAATRRSRDAASR
jgi:hypothetical protein